MYTDLPLVAISKIDDLEVQDHQGLNYVVAIILCYFIEFGTFTGQLCPSGWSETPTVSSRNV